MTIDELTRNIAAAEYPAITAPIDAFCQQQQIGFAEFSDQFARHIATSYQQGRLDWLDADTAISNLHSQAMLRAEHTWLSEFAFSVYLAFDAGEHHPKTPHLSPDEVTRPLIDALLPNQGVQ